MPAAHESRSVLRFVSASPSAVVKLGGSLLDLPDLVSRLEHWRPLWGARPLLVVGGGAAANLVREWDQQSQLGEQRAHWLALDSLELTARFLAALWPVARVVSRSEIESSWGQGVLPVIRPREWFEAAGRASERTPPHTWETTTDTIAAWVASVSQAESLWLLKSVECADSLGEAARLELVDPQFVHWVPTGLPVQWVNFREVSGTARLRRLNALEK